MLPSFHARLFYCFECTTVRCIFILHFAHSNIWSIQWRGALFGTHLESLCRSRCTTVHFSRSSRMYRSESESISSPVTGSSTSDAQVKHVVCMSAHLFKLWTAFYLRQWIVAQSHRRPSSCSAGSGWSHCVPPWHYIVPSCLACHVCVCERERGWGRMGVRYCVHVCVLVGCM